MTQFLALSILCCCAAIAAAVCLRDAILAVQDRCGKPWPCEPTDNEVPEIVY
jgi:hypothetical protein